jgi:putative transcriptional regulator
MMLSPVATAQLDTARYVKTQNDPAQNGPVLNDRKGQRESIVLVAARHLIDPNFAHTVVLVMFPVDAGPSGVILNRPSPLQLREMWPEDPQRQGRGDTIFFGGPLQPDGLLFLFRMNPPPQRAWWAVDDIYFSGNGKVLATLLDNSEPDPEQRFFAGYAGWAPGQLESEIANGDWYVLKADPQIIYDTDYDTLWWRMYQRATLPRADAVPAQETRRPGKLVTQSPSAEGTA